MAAVTTASLCPGLGKPRRGHAMPPRTTVCHCLPARRTEEGMKRRDALLGVLLSTTAASSAPLLVPAEAFAEAAGNARPPVRFTFSWLGCPMACTYPVEFLLILRGAGGVHRVRGRGQQVHARDSTRCFTFVVKRWEEFSQNTVFLALKLCAAESEFARR